ncbi:hypothetical protein KSC_004460 [Ktedonobacter sp. SOSP1-52]|nr:hypothetical protein KSC_004460 [Ktedonobacter sp. SOSP1-52]
MNVPLELDEDGMSDPPRPIWSPDGTQIAFVDAWSLQIVDLQGTPHPFPSTEEHFIMGGDSLAIMAMCTGLSIAWMLPLASEVGTYASNSNSTVPRERSRADHQVPSAPHDPGGGRRWCGRSG